MGDLQHTREPWRVSGSGTMRFIDAPVGNGVVQEVATCMRVGYGGMDANARRIVACVNACAGVETIALEQLANSNGLTRVFNERAEYSAMAGQLEQQRDQLLRALDQLVQVTKHLHPCPASLDLAARAITAAKGAK